MKRRVVLEIDDTVWREREDARRAEKAHVRVLDFLGHLLGPMRRDNQRTTAVGDLKQYGVVLISDEQID